MALQTTTNPLSIELNHYTGLKLDRPDPRDIEKVYGAPQIPTADHPVVDLRKYIKQVYTQGKMNSCGANVLCAAYELLLEEQAESQNRVYYHFFCSRMYVYYNSRTYDGETGVDVGASIRDTLRAMLQWGICKETLWPYDIQKVTQKPPQPCYDDGKGNTLNKFENLRQEIDQFRACLKAGFPFAFGFRIYKSFLSINKGFVPTPSPQEIAAISDPLLHGVLAVGYDDTTKCITALNSWGEEWGDKGYFYMPYDYITDPKLAFNFWKIEHAMEKFEIEVFSLP